MINTIKKNRNLIAAIIGVIILAILTRTDTSKKLLNFFKKDLQEKEISFKKQYDSVQSLRKKETADYLESLDNINQELEQINNRLELQRQKTKTI